MADGEAEVGLLALEGDLEGETNGWTVPWLVATYDGSEDGDEDRQDDELVLTSHGYVAAYNSPTADGEVVTFAREELADTIGDLGDGAEALVGRPLTLVRSYGGTSHDEAVLWFQSEAGELAQYGYEPTSQSWAENQGGPGVMSVVMFGAFAAPKRGAGGTLTVTYGRREAAHIAAGQSESGSPVATSIPDLIHALGGLRDQGLLSEDEFQAKKRELLARL